MNEKRTVNVVEGKAGKLSLRDEQQYYDEHFIRSFAVEAQSLRMIEFIDKSFDVYGEETKILPRLKGVCSPRDARSVRIIGRPELRGTNLTLSIIPSSNPKIDAVAKLPDGDLERKAVLGWGFGEPWLEITIPSVIFLHLVSEIRGGWLRRLTVSVDFKRNMFLTTDWMYEEPPYEPRDWFLRPSKEDGDTDNPEMAEGVVRNMSWGGEEWHAPTVAEAVEHEGSEASQPSKTDIQLDRLLRDVASIAGSAQKIKSVIARVGWILIATVVAGLLSFGGHQGHY